MLIKIEPKQNPSEKVEQVVQISKKQFFSRYFKPKKPLVMKNMIADWPAMDKWSFQFFSQLQCENSVYIEAGNVLLQDTHFQQTKLNDYLRALDDSHTGVSQAQTKIPYLSLFNIFSVFPFLSKDVDFSLLSTHTFNHYIYAWLGPAGTISGFHIDWIDNLLAQVVGRKKVELVSPAHSEYMYPSSKYDYGSSVSSIDPDNYDQNKYPLFKQAQVIEVLLEPGDMLYIPRGWWHRVTSLDASISVNHFGDDLKGLLLYRTQARILGFLHYMGLYGHDCTCHMQINGKRIARSKL